MADALFDDDEADEWVGTGAKAEDKADPGPGLDGTAATQAAPEILESYKEAVVAQWPDPPDIPPRWIAAEKGDKEKAIARYDVTRKWRAEKNLDQILDEPQKYYSFIKANYPGYYHGRSKKGYQVYIEKISKAAGLNYAKLKENGVGHEELLKHNTFISEYTWNVTSPKDTDRVVVIIDCKGLGFFEVFSDSISFVKKTIKMYGEHYPERQARCFIINAPTFVWGTFKTISVLMDPVTKQKTTLYGTGASEEKKAREAILEWIDPSVLPEEYGGTGPPLGSSQETLAEKAFVEAKLKAAGVEPFQC